MDVVSKSYEGIVIAWANGEDRFNIAPLGMTLGLEEKCEAGIAMILARLQAGAWKYNDVRETIRFGLIGGGMSEKDAMRAVRTHVDAADSLARCALLAHEIISHRLVGQQTVPDDPLGKPAAGRAATEDSTGQMAASSDPQFTATAQPSDSIPAQ